MFRELTAAQDGRHPFEAEAYVNRYPAAKHDHFLIPAGTVHCSGRNSMVLEISATPYLFTFKMWDWGRLGLDGVPRPVHLDHGRANVQTGRRTTWVAENLVNRTEELATGRAGGRSAPVCTSSSSSRSAGTGSPARCSTTPPARSTC